MKSKHTPGPWEIDSVKWPKRPHCYVIENEPQWCDNKSILEIQANAVLIASAPELLEALKMAYSALDTDTENNPQSTELMEKIETAIAKAESRS